MIKHHLKMAFRSLGSQKLFSAINIGGLALGLAVCMVIMLYVAHELSYNRFFKDADRIYTISQRLSLGNATMEDSHFSYVSGPLVKQSDAGVADYTRLYQPYTDALVQNTASPDLKFTESKMLFADEGFFNFFSFKLIAGNAKTVLSRPFSVVISQSAATRYFGAADPVGKTLSIKTDSALTYLITGVAENAPSNSSIEYDFIASNSSLPAMHTARSSFKSQVMEDGEFKTYFLLKPGADTAKVLSTMQLLVDKGRGSAKGVRKAQVVLTPLTAIHLKTGSGNSNLKYLKIFPLTAGLILLLALANYMSLATARSTLRAKEVGVRKVSGANRASLIGQFYTESAVYGIIAFVLAYMLCYLITPWFLNRLQLHIDTAFFHSPVIICSMAALLLFTIVVAGTYPSIVLSAFKPVTILKGKGDKRSAGYLVRKFFTTTQFIITIALLICGVVIDRQLSFFRNADTGVNRENVVSVTLAPSFKYNYQAFKNDLQSLAGISQISTAMHPLYNKYYDISTIKGRYAEEKITFNSMQVDENFMATLGIRWAYKPSSLKNVMAAHQVIINEAAAQALHISNNPVGFMLPMGRDTAQVAGVVKNFVYASMEKTISPMYFFLIPASTTGWGGAAGCVYLKIKPSTNIPQLLGTIRQYYKRYDTETPFIYQFMDDAFNNQYKAEDRLATIFSFFTIVTIVLAALGLFGLAAFTIEQRRKEIGIRKILGANLLGITTLLSTEFLKLVVLAIVIASPIAWWAMQNWLQVFAYRIHLQVWMFAAAGVLAIMVAAVTVGYHALRAAVANPVDSLRSE